MAHLDKFDLDLDLDFLAQHSESQESLYACQDFEQLSGMLKNFKTQSLVFRWLNAVGENLLWSGKETNVKL